MNVKRAGCRFHIQVPIPIEVGRQASMGALQWMMREMDARYHKFAAAGARNLEDYNVRMQLRGEKRLPKLVIDQAENSVEEGSPETLPQATMLRQVDFWSDGAGKPNEDPLLSEVTELVRREGRASISMLQRRMRIGYTRAARLIDRMEELGIISGTQPNTQTREVLDYGQTAPPEDDGA